MAPTTPASSELAGFTYAFEPGASGWTVLALHSTGGDEHELVTLARRLAPGAAVLSPRGKVLEGGVARRFFRRHGPGRLDVPDLLARTDEVAAFLAAGVARHALDPQRVVAVGYSNGANVAVDLLLRHGPSLRAAVLLRPMLPYEPQQRAQLAGTDVLIAAGEHDHYASPAMTRRLAAVLLEGDARVAVTTEAGAGHGLTRGDLAAAQRWMTALAAAGPAEHA